MVVCEEGSEYGLAGVVASETADALAGSRHKPLVGERTRSLIGKRGRSAGGVTGGEHGAEMDVTRCTYTPLNPYQGPREAGERADLLLPELGGKGHQAAMLGLDSTWMAVSLTPRWILLSRRRSVQRTCNSHRRSRGQTVMDGQSSRTLGRQSVSLAEFPSGNADQTAPCGLLTVLLTAVRTRRDFLRPRTAEAAPHRHVTTPRDGQPRSLNQD